MLNALRRGAKGWAAQLLIALLVVAFAVWGVSDFFSGFRGDTVATVGDTGVPTQRFYRQYELAKRQLAQQIRQPVTDQQASVFGIPGQVLGQLVTEATLTNQADALNLGVSGETLSQQIANDPSFRGSTGSFDRAVFSQVVSSNGMTENDFIEELREGYVRQQLASALAGGVEVPDAYLRAFHEYQAEERNIDYLVLPPSLVGDVPPPTETELIAFFEEHQSDWRAPELRSVRVMAMTPADLADTGDISDEEARNLYDGQVAARFTTPERRRVEQIVFDSSGDATAAASALADGATFEDLVAERGLTPTDIDLGVVTQAEILDTTTAEAVFALAEGETSGLIEGRFGPVIVRVTSVEPEVVQPFDDVKTELKQELAESRAAQEISDQLDVIEDARAGGATLDEIATNYGLSLVTYPAVDSRGNDGDGEPIADLPGGNELVAAIFESDIGLENNAIPLEVGYVWYEVAAVSEPRDRELSEVRERVLTAYRDAAIDERLTDSADEIRDRLARGEDIATIAEDYGVAVNDAEAVTRLTPPSGDLTGVAIQAAFGGPRGHTAVADGENQNKVVIAVSEVTIPAYFSGLPASDQMAARLSTEISNDYLQQYVTQLQNLLSVSVNQAALQQVINPPAHGGLHQGM
ncbi:SurA N-terminal domain-containing protein [Bauldia sp.]|uniref:peptidylprolyl isomerase n=1 Tax=Bauldia sp. TaxID=2575872 RepID=UPI003BAB819B